MDLNSIRFEFDSLAACPVTCSDVAFVAWFVGFPIVAITMDLVIVAIVVLLLMFVSRKGPVVPVGGFPHLVQTRLPLAGKHVLGRSQGNVSNAIGLIDALL